MEIANFEKYLPQLEAEFPDIDKKSIREVCRHGLSFMGFFQTKGHDILCLNNMQDLYYYFGQVTNVVEKRFEISRKKHRRKMRLMHSLLKKPYEGYMYFVLSDPQYEAHLRGERIEKLYLFKVQEECKLFKPGKHFFKLKMDNPFSWMVIKENYETTDAEYIH